MAHKKSLFLNLNILAISPKTRGPNNIDFSRKYLFKLS